MNVGFLPGVVVFVPRGSLLIYGHGHGSIASELLFLRKERTN